MKTWIVRVLFALVLADPPSLLQAAPITQPGEQAGLAPGYPLPEGFYTLNTFSWGRGDRAGAPDVGVNIPALVWSSPFKVLGARVEPVLTVPSIFVNTHPSAPFPERDVSIFGNPFVASLLAWDLGEGLGVSYLLGAYLPFGDRGSLGVGRAGTPLLPQLASTSLRQSFNVTYLGDGNINLSASLTYSLALDPHARFGGAVGRSLGPIPQADTVNLDLTATRKFGAFEVGAVAFAYTDLPVNRGDDLYTGYQRNGVIAAGGLVGYDFGSFAMQAFVTRDIVARETTNAAGLRQRNEEIRGWFRIIVPFLATPPLREVR